MIGFEARKGVFRVYHIRFRRRHGTREVSQQASHQYSDRRWSPSAQYQTTLHSIIVTNFAALTRFSIAPSPLISTFTTSPALSHRGGLNEAPTPPHVPVNNKSPGSRVTACVIHAIWAKQSNTMFLVLLCCRTSPLT